MAVSKARADECPNKPVGKCREDDFRNDNCCVILKGEVCCSILKISPTVRKSASVLHYPNDPFFAKSKTLELVR